MNYFSSSEIKFEELMEKELQIRREELSQSQNLLNFLVTSNKEQVEQQKTLMTLMCQLINNNKSSNINSNNDNSETGKY